MTKIFYNKPLKMRLFIPLKYMSKIFKEIIDLNELVTTYFERNM